MNKQAQIDRVVNEGGEGYSLAAQQADDARRARERANEAAFEVEQAAAKAAFAAEWTVEVLAARRAAWNAEMMDLSARKVGMTSKVMSGVVAKLGYTLSDLKMAKALHGVA